MRYLVYTLVSLLYDIQASLLNSAADLGPTLLKVRLLAAKLGSQPLADWVKHESGGYPKDALLPDYRIIPVEYRATFLGPGGSQIKNAPIPSARVEELAGKHWTNYEMRQGIASVDQLLAGLDKGAGTLKITASNLILVLQDEIYPGYSCVEASGSLAASSLAQLRHAVQSRLLELTIELEKSLPGATSITSGQSNAASTVNASAATQITQQIIYGNMTTIAASDNARVNVGIQAGDTKAIVRLLSAKGMPVDDAEEFAKIVASEAPEGSNEPFGKKAQTWLVKNLSKAAAGTWKMGITAATEVLKEAALNYYGLK